MRTFKAADWCATRAEWIVCSFFSGPITNVKGGEEVILITYISACFILRMLQLTLCKAWKPCWTTEGGDAWLPWGLKSGCGVHWNSIGRLGGLRVVKWYDVYTIRKMLDRAYYCDSNALMSLIRRCFDVRNRPTTIWILCIVRIYLLPANCIAWRLMKQIPAENEASARANRLENALSIRLEACRSATGRGWLCTYKDPAVTTYYVYW